MRLSFFDLTVNFRIGDNVFVQALFFFHDDMKRWHENCIIKGQKIC